jgi:hypothetical protein
MAAHTGNWYPIGPVLWDASGNPYRDTSDGMKAYIPPIAAAQERDNPKLLAWAKAHGANVTYGPNDANGNPTTSDVRTGAPENSYMHGQASWNADTGEWEYPNFFDTPFGSTVLGGSAVAAPIAISALTGAPTAGAASSVGPMAGAETGMAATTASTAAPASIAATTASSVPAWLRPTISAAAPFAIRAATGGGGSGTGGVANGLNSEQNDLLTQLIKMSMQRQQESAPIHQAAMALAGNLAPKGTWGDSPRFQ